MKKRISLFCSALIFCSAVFAAENVSAIWQKADTMKLTRYAQIGFVCRNTKTNDTIESYFSHKIYTPASVTKLITTATALELLGEDYKFRTWVEYSGEINQNGTLNGTIFLRGEGDPSLGSSDFPDSLAFLRKWATAVSRAGIRKVNGSIVAEIGNYDDEFVSPFWLREDIGTYYGAGIFPLSCYDNSAYVTLNTKSGEVKIDRFSPKLCRLDTVFSRVHISRTVAKNDVVLAGEPFYGPRYLRGELRPYQDKMNFRCDISNPPLLLANAFRNELETYGISVSGECRVENTFGGKGRTLLYVNYSPTLVEIVRVTNYYSNNNYAEHIFKRLSADEGAVASFQKSAEIVAGFWAKQGIDTSAAFQYDGSGLSTKDAFSPDFIVDILSYMNARSEHSEAFLASLPTAGVCGTVQNLMKKCPEHNNFYVKSGSFRNVQCYAGYFVKNGETYAFAVMANNYNGSRAEIRCFIEEILLYTYKKVE